MSAFTLHDLEQRVRDRAEAVSEKSYTRKLLDRGVDHAPRSSAKRRSKPRLPRWPRIGIE